MIKTILRAAALAAGIVGLAACGTIERPPSVTIADHLLEPPSCAGAPDSRDCLMGRSLRAGELARVYVAVLALDPDPADYGRALATLVAVERLQAARDDPFIGTELAYFRVALGRLVLGDVRDEVKVSLLGVTDIAGEIADRLSQLEIAWGGLEDARRRLVMLADGSLPEDQAWTELSARMERDVRRMEPVMDISPSDPGVPP